MTEESFYAGVAHILAHYTDGELIPHEELQRILQYEKPMFDGDIEKYEQDMKNAQFQWLSMVERLKNELLEAYSIALRNVYGEGYQIVLPKEQTSYALKSGLQAIKKEIAWMDKTITNIRIEQLTDAERRENTDAQARLAQMRQIFNSRKKPSFSSLTSAPSS